MTTTSEPWLIALDIDGTVLHEDGHLSDEVLIAVQKARDAGHEVTLATGRSVSMTIPILERLNITPEFVVCSNG
ncbi:HAD family hydrolase, partial [Pontimonas sp.]